MQVSGLAFLKSSYGCVHLPIYPLTQYGYFLLSVVNDDSDDTLPLCQPHAMKQWQLCKQWVLSCSHLILASSSPTSSLCVQWQWWLCEWWVPSPSPPMCCCCLQHAMPWCAHPHLVLTLSSPILSLCMQQWWQPLLSTCLTPHWQWTMMTHPHPLCCCCHLLLLSSPSLTDDINGAMFSHCCHHLIPPPSPLSLPLLFMASWQHLALMCTCLLTPSPPSFTLDWWQWMTQCMQPCIVSFLVLSVFSPSPHLTHSMPLSSPYSSCHPLSHLMHPQLMMVMRNDAICTIACTVSSLVLILILTLTLHNTCGYTHPRVSVLNLHIIFTWLSHILYHLAIHLVAFHILYSSYHIHWVM